jgi:UDP-N-acetylmuramoyl-tripeptide--D-alanyl-D-alanine ligase
MERHPERPIAVVEDTLQALGDLAHWWRQGFDVRVVAITGSVGKTTTKEMVASIMQMGASTLKNLGNRNNLVGLPLTLLELCTTHKWAVLEMGMNRPGEIGRLTEIADPDVGLITKIGEAHLEGVGGLEGVAKAKMELVEKISTKGKVILNGDDPLLLRKASRLLRDWLSFGMSLENDVRASHVEDLGAEGISFDLEYREHSCPVRLRVPGIHNVSNALGAASAALCLGEPMDHISQGLERFSGVEGRFVVTRLPGDITLVDDTYNSNPASLQAALNALQSLSKGEIPVIVGLGEMMELGSRAPEAHREAGRRVARIEAEYLVVMGDHATQVIQGALSAGMSKDRATEAASHQDMADRIRERIDPPCVLLLKGSRGMELDKVVKELQTFFS